MSTFILFLVTSLSFSSTSPILKELNGAKTLTVMNGKKKNKIKKHGKLKTPVKIKTDAKTSAVIEFGDGTVMSIGHTTEVEILNKTGVTQWNDLEHGNVRSQVAKAKTPSKNYLFGFRTKSAVMGVRGTDFVVTADQEKKTSELRTLDGEVHVAKDEKTLNDGKGIPVLQNQMTQMSPGSIQAPVSFNRDEFMKKLSTSQPDLAKLAPQVPSVPSMPTTPSVTLPPVTVPPVTAPPVTAPPAPAAPAVPKVTPPKIGF